MIEWAVSVSAAVVFVALIMLLLPEGKLIKFIKPFVSVAVLVIILSPISKTTDIKELFSFDYSENAVNFDENFIMFINEEKIAVYRENCSKIAQNDGINGAEFIIKYIENGNGGLSVTGAEINLKNAVITSDAEHIVILQRLKTDVASYLNIDTERVTIYER